MNPSLLPAPAAYSPWRSGRYEVAPLLRPLGTDFGNGPADSQAFQLDRRFPEYRENKLRARAERLSKYFGEVDYEPPVAAAVARFFLARWTEEHPDCFHLEDQVLHCALTGEQLPFDADMRLARPVRDYADAFDALCCQVQEDVAVVRTSPERGDWVAALHVCAPSHWVPEEKLGQHFAAVHRPVPGIERVNSVSAAMVHAMIHRGPFVRFVWGIDTDRRLNRHAQPPPGESPESWRGPDFDPQAESPFIVRVERQVTWGLSEAQAAIFLIRPYQIEASALRPEDRALLRDALLSMSPQSRTYKGVAPYFDQLVAWLGASV